MTTTWPLWLAAGIAVTAGAAGGQLLVGRGLAQLGEPCTRTAGRTGRVAAAIAGVVAVLAVQHAGSWWLLPAALAWAYALAAAATCDALTQRIPTPLVRQGGLASAVLLALAAAASGQWRWAVLAAVSAAVAGVILSFCWRFGGAGFGDVRLAVLGLAAPTYRGLAVAVLAVIVITVGQATVVLARGGTGRSTFPYGPAIAIAFALVAVA